MRSPIQRSLTKLAVLLAVVLASVLPVAAQSRSEAETFVNSVAKTIYNLAWPTATYRSVNLDDIEPTDRGADIVVRLNGISAWDDSSLWVRLVIQIRDGEIADIKVRDHNAILVAPFATTRALAQAASEMAKEYAAEHPNQNQAPTPAPSPSAPERTPASPSPEGICISNTTDSALNFTYRWGAAEWKSVSIQPDHTVRIWWSPDPGDTAAPILAIRYDDDFAPGFHERSYNLTHTAASLPFACDAVANYHFALTGTKILVYAN